MKTTRKVLEQGGSLTITLPHKWCRFNSIDNGDALEVYILDNEVHVMPLDKQAIAETPCEVIPTPPECKSEFDVEKRVARMLALERGEL